jgi:hypothetical protein
VHQVHPLQHGLHTLLRTLQASHLAAEGGGTWKGRRVMQQGGSGTCVSNAWVRVRAVFQHPWRAGCQHPVSTNTSAMGATQRRGKDHTASADAAGAAGLRATGGRAMSILGCSILRTWRCVPLGTWRGNATQMRGRPHCIDPMSTRPCWGRWAECLTLEGGHDLAVHEGRAAIEAGIQVKEGLAGEGTRQACGSSGSRSSG